MFIRRTQTRSSRSGEAYCTFRLVRSERVGPKVRQRTLLNLGRHFPLGQTAWPVLCRRIDEVLTRAEPPQHAIYDALSVDPQPGGIQKTIV